MSLIIRTIKNIGLSEVKKRIEADKLNWEEEPVRKTIWLLYSQGLNTRSIQKEVKKQNMFISSVLSEKKMVEIIAQNTVINLRKYPDFDDAFKSPPTLNKFVYEFSKYLCNKNDSPKLIMKFVREVLES